MQVSGRQITERGRRSKHRSGEEAGDRNTSSVTLAMSAVQKNRQHASGKQVRGRLVGAGAVRYGR